MSFVTGDILGVNVIQELLLIILCGHMHGNVSQIINFVN